MSLLPGLFADYGYVPVMLIGVNGLALGLAANGVPLFCVGALALVALGLTFLVERVRPYQPDWNSANGDTGKDAAHGIVYELSNINAILVMPAITWLMPWQDIWPRHWPLWGQVVAAVLAADCAMTLLHYVSHRVSWLWSLHSVHHGVSRLYGFNGLVRHPLHQQFDLAVGALPLALAGMPVDVAVLLGLAITVQLIVQHSNVDCRVGPFQHLLAIGPVHRLHHVNWAGEGDVNFGLFFTIWDRALGTFRLAAHPRLAAGDIGVEGKPSYPQSYLAQLALPFMGERAMRPNRASGGVASHSHTCDCPARHIRNRLKRVRDF